MKKSFLSFFQIPQLVISAGLGFDSYVVMRHGFDDEEHPERQKLSCYFCADLSAPKDVC